VGGPVLHAAYALMPQLALRLQAEVMVNVLRVDSQVVPRVVPAVGLGVLF
jgi:hypothetical protein